MEEMRRILVFILCGLCAVSALSGKGYFCRDPDTGKLHPANSTWPSISFCGNYTCKLRKKIQGNEPIRELNVTNVNITKTTEARYEDTQSDGEFAASNITPQIIAPTHVPDNLNLKTLLSPQLHNQLNNIQEKLKQKIDLEGGDRYLTEIEIKTISDLLRTVKKSDLEAIVDIYNLAQDVYKEMDKITSENIIEEAMRLAPNINTQKVDRNQISYWYDPVNQYHKAEVNTDMIHQGTNPVPTTTQPVANPSPYFPSALSGKDFGKMPYYYPLSSFQRQSSYVHPAYYTQTQPQPANVKPPCSKNSLTPPSHQHAYPPQGYPPPQNYPYQTYQPQSYSGLRKRPFSVETQNLIQPSILLPYPFSYVQHYNMSAYPFHQFYAENPWTQFVINSQNSRPRKESDAKSSDINEIPDTNIKETLKLIPEKNKNNVSEGNLLENLLTNVKIGKKREWITDPLPTDVLEDIKAHFEEKSNLLKPLSLRKKVKLERVGKVVKLNDLDREKRSMDDGSNKENVENEDLEAYIEKTTCHTDIDPGFFRMGNQSEPYPACCPQRIDANKP